MPVTKRKAYAASHKRMTGTPTKPGPSAGSTPNMPKGLQCGGGVKDDKFEHGAKGQTKGW